MPGLVNSHAHTPMTLVRGAGDGLPLMEWLTKVMWPREGQMTPEDALWHAARSSRNAFVGAVLAKCISRGARRAAQELVSASMTPE